MKNWLKKLKKLTISGEGGMKDILNRSTIYPNIAKKVLISIAWLNNEPIGWAMVDYVHHDKADWVKYLKPKEIEQDFYNLNVYVSPKFRKLGIGSKLVSNIRKGLKPYPIKTYGWDKKGKEFYKKLIKEFISCYLVVH